MTSDSCVQPLASRTALIDALAAPGASLVVLDLHRTWCGPCTSLEPTFKKIFDEQNEKRKTAKQDAAAAESSAEEGDSPTVPILPPSLVPNALQVVSVSVESLKEWFGLVSNDDEGGDDGTGTGAQTSSDGGSVPPVPVSVSDESVSKSHSNPNNGSTNLADLLAISDFFGPSEIEKLGLVVDEGKATCKPVYVFLQVVTASDGTSAGVTNKSKSQSVGAGSMPLPQAVPYKVAELVNGADAPKVYSLVNTFLAAA